MITISRPRLVDHGVSDCNAHVPVRYLTRQRSSSFPSRRRRVMMRICGPNEDAQSSNYKSCGALWQADRKSRILPEPKRRARWLPEQSICHWAEKTFVAFLGTAASLMLTPVDTCALEAPDELTASRALRNILPYVVPDQSVEERQALETPGTRIPRDGAAPLTLNNSGGDEETIEDSKVRVGRQVQSEYERQQLREELQQRTQEWADAMWQSLE